MINTVEDNEQERTGKVPSEVKAIKSSSKYMLALVSDVLDLGRLIICPSVLIHILTNNME